MDDYIKRRAALSAVSLGANRHYINEFIKDIPSEDVQPSTPGQLVGGVLERNIDNILQAGLEGKEFRFSIGGRLFAVRELPQ